MSEFSPDEIETLCAALRDYRANLLFLAAHAITHDRELDKGSGLAKSAEGAQALLDRLSASTANSEST